MATSVITDRGKATINVSTLHTSLKIALKRINVFASDDYFQHRITLIEKVSTRRENCQYE